MGEHCVRSGAIFFVTAITRWRDAPSAMRRRGRASWLKSRHGASAISSHPPAGPAEAEIAVARFQGKRVAQVTKKLIAA
jgi:hypothetical protein